MTCSILIGWAVPASPSCSHLCGWMLMHMHFVPLQQLIDKIMEAQTSSGSGAAGIVHFGEGVTSIRLDKPVALAGGQCQWRGLHHVHLVRMGLMLQLAMMGPCFRVEGVHTWLLPSAPSGLHSAGEPLPGRSGHAIRL